MNQYFEKLKEAFKKVYVNPYSKESSFILKIGKGGIYLCFKEFYIALYKSGQYSILKYEE